MQVTGIQTITAQHTTTMYTVSPNSVLRLIDCHANHPIHLESGSRLELHNTVVNAPVTGSGDVKTSGNCTINAQLVVEISLLVESIMKT